MKIKLYVVVLFTLTVLNVKSQDSTISHSFYIIGNTTKLPGDKTWESFRALLKQTKENFTLVHTGDLSNKDPEHHKKVIDKLSRTLYGIPNGKIYFIPGDKDWDNSKKDGYEKVKSLEKEIETLLPGSFIPSSGCPGPKVIDISNDIRLIAINSQWWMQPYEKPTTHNNDCKCRSEQEFLDNLDEIINESEGKNIIIVGHHPIVSQGSYGGHIPVKRHLFPFPDSYFPAPGLGTIYAAYRQNAGTVRDMAHPSYQRFIRGMNRIFQKNQGIIYVSSHDYNLQLNYHEGNYQVISGSISRSEEVGKDRDETRFRSSDNGFCKLEYLNDGTVKIKFFSLKHGTIKELYSKILLQSACASITDPSLPINNSYAPCANTNIIPPFAHPPFASIAAGTVYKAGFIKRLFFGSLYRKNWMEPVSVPYLDLDTAKGGLIPYARGGGRQTLSLKFKSGNGNEFTFRSIDKDFTRVLLPPKLKNTFLEPVLRDVTATQHPYGALPVAKMLDATEIYHGNPELYVLPDDPRLSNYRKDFAGMFGIMEEKPSDKKNGQSYKGADNINQSATMISKLYENHNNKIEVENFAKSRVFDILIGDWGRHEDNYKWAAYKSKDGTLFYPIPRDRDQAFSRWNGIIPSFADGFWALPFIENFDYKFHNLKSLNYNARHIDRLLLASLNRQDWEKMSEYIIEKVNDQVIDEAMSTFPSEVKKISADQISKKLKARRRSLTKAIDEYYMVLAEKVDVVGSNKNEYFDVERLPNGNVLVKMKAKEDSISTGEKILFQREFIHSETHEICLYGLGGDDDFAIKGKASKSILIRIIGGDGNDKIVDSGFTGVFNKETYAYDTKNTSLILGKGAKDKTSDEYDINHYDRHDFKYNTIIPSFAIFYRRDDGLGFTFEERYTIHGFRKQDFKTQYDFALSATTNQNIYLNTKVDWRQVLGKTDVVFMAGLGRYFPNFNFFGFGNSSEKIESLYNTEYYLLRPSGINTGIFLERKFFKQAYFHIGPVLERINIKAVGPNLEEKESIPNGPVLGGIETLLNFDLRDRKIVASKGFRFYGKFTPYYDFDNSANFNVAEGFIEYYASLKLLLPITLGAEVGGSKVSGDKIPLNKYTFLGQKNHLRGFVRHRFTGDQSAYLNTEMRVQLGKSRNHFLPFYFGVFGFKDFGRVWYKGTTGDWHGAEGGGFYIVPISRSLTFRCSVEHSAEEKVLLDIGAGFYLDR